jgi:hypothetical protein
MACPFGAPSFNEDQGVMTKCHLCAPRQEKGLQPACTRACPTGALRFSENVTTATAPFQVPVFVPGFADPGSPRPNLRLAPPRGGLRDARYQELKTRVGVDEEERRGPT